jgi:hypothetical protein
MTKSFNADIFSGRRRALDRAMDEALKKPTKRRVRKADGIVCGLLLLLVDP